MWDLIVSVPDHCLSFYEHKTYLSTKLMICFKTFREIHPRGGFHERF